MSNNNRCKCRVKNSPGISGWWYTFFVCLMLVLDTPVRADQLIKIGVLAHRGGDVALKTWQPLAGYLDGKLPGLSFRIVPLDLSETSDVVQRHDVDFILTNPGNYISLEKKFAVHAIATLEKSYAGRRLRSFGAVIFVRADNHKIKTISDLKGTRFMGVKPGAFGGFQMAWYALKKNNIDPFTDIKELQFSGFPQSAVVMAVQNGIIDAGTVRTGVLEALAEKGKIKLEDFRILNKQRNGNFPLLLSTVLYPEWPFSRLATTPQALVDKLSAVLLTMPGDIIKIGKTRVTGWSKPHSYEPVHNLMQQLQVGPYKSDHAFTPMLVLKKYLLWVILILAFIIVMIIFLLRIILLNRKLINTAGDLEYKISESLLLEQSLNKERNFLKAILNNISDGVVAFNTKGELTLINDAGKNIAGIYELDAKNPQWQNYFDFFEVNGLTPLAQYDNPFFKVLSGQQIFNHELILKSSDLHSNILVSGQAIISDSGESLGGVLSFYDVTEKNLKDRRLRKSEKELSAILDNMQDTYYRTNLEGKVIRISQSVINMLGFEYDESLGMDLSSLYVDKEGRKKFIQKLEQSNGSVQNYQAPMWHKDGHQVWVSTSAHYHFDEDGNLDGVEGVTRDITELKNAEARLFEEKERAHITLNSIGDGVVTLNVQGCVEFINPYAEQMMGCSLESVQNQPLSDYLQFADAETHVPLENPVGKCLDEEEVIVYSDHIHAIRNDGTRFAVKLTISPMHNQSRQIIGVVIVMHDVSEMWKMAQQLSYQASHDALTGLINRREFDRQLDQAFENSKKTGIQHTLCYMDLDQFKIVNDTCGHIAGDKLLKQLSQIMVDIVREQDIFARLGGDEFGLLLSGCPLGRAENIVEKIRKVVEDFRFVWQEKSFELGMSIGMVPITIDSINVTELLSEADAACYVAKEQGRNRIHKFQHGDTGLVKHKNEMQWVNRIQQALDENRLTVYCQSIQPVSTDERHYSEILVRMLDENGDVILPGAFIPAAERYRLMTKIDLWVIQKVFSMYESYQYSDTYFTINLSGQTVGDEATLQFILDSIIKFKVDASRFCFEITETAAVANLDSARIFIDRLHEVGCQFALDDFGSGLSSFAYLKNLNVDYLKIDGSFVRDIAHDPVDYAMVSSINKIGHLMGIKTVAEFVEDGEILQRLKDIGVDYVQGYYIDRPSLFSGDINIGKAEA